MDIGTVMVGPFFRLLTGAIANYIYITPLHHSPTSQVAAHNSLT